jgi:RNA-directed DNA polymerase
MIEQIINRRNMRLACQHVVSNKGSGGVDDMQVKELFAWWRKHRDELAHGLVHGRYLCSPILGVEIPKGNGKMRLLGIPTVVDRMLQQAVSQVIAIRFETEFKDSSFGFRPNRNAQQAVMLAQQFINEGYQHIVDIDLKSFFDEVDHTLLLQLLYRKVKCPTTLRLIRQWLRAPIVINGKLTKRRKGVPQGSPLSPLLSNIMLHELDKQMEKQGLRSVRYADDFSIYTKSEAEARRIGNSIYKYLKYKLKLPINREKSGIRKPVSFKILGFKFVPTMRKGEKGKYQTVVSEKGWDNLKRKLKAATKANKPFSFDQRIKQIKEVSQGWIYYFRMASIYQKLKDLDAWVRHRLRQCIWHDWKRPERKRKNLIRLGVDKERAFAWSRTRMGKWAVAQSPILFTTITLERLQRRGYQSMLDYYYQVAPHYHEPLYARPACTVV